MGKKSCETQKAISIFQIKTAASWKPARFCVGDKFTLLELSEKKSFEKICCCDYSVC